MSASCVVCFQAENCDLSKAILSLEKYKFDVQQLEEKLTVSRSNHLEFDIFLVKEDYVQEEAMNFSEGTKYQREMSKCDARFEIIIGDLDKALEEANTLMEVQAALQDATKGYLFIPWNGNILEPYLG